MKKILWSILQDLLLLSGCALITYGIWRINIEAALITAGIFAVGLAILIAKGGSGNEGGN